VKITEEWENWDEEEEVAKSKEEAKKLVPQRFHKWIHVLEKKASERMLTKKVVGLCNKGERRICAKGGEGISIIKERERRGAQVH